MNGNSYAIEIGDTYLIIRPCLLDTRWTEMARESVVLYSVILQLANTMIFTPGDLDYMLPIDLCLF
jgi:hypothetical protein